MQVAHITAFHRLEPPRNRAAFLHGVSQERIR